MDSNLLMTVGLGVLALGAIAFVAYPYLSGDIKAERRMDALQASAKRGGERVVDAANRRKQITDSLKDLEGRGTKRKVTLENRIGQAGLAWSAATFHVISAALGSGLGAVMFLVSGAPTLALGVAAVAGLGVPRWYLSVRRKRRINKFLNEFPSADRVPIPEASFFAIVISIQQKAGGNLSEALSNLSRVLRDRKKMKAKVKAVSSEAKSSASIIGALPFAVGGLLYLTSPRYIELLWTTEVGRMMMGVGAVWMALGIVVMRKMIAFEI